MLDNDIKHRLISDRAYFFKALFPHYIKTDLALGMLHNEWFNLLSTYQKLLIVAPRSHAKSTIINLIDNLFDICNQNKRYIMIICDTPEQAKEHLGNIVEELENNELLIKIYGRLYESRQTLKGKKEKWTEDEIITRTGIKVVARSWRLKTRGARFKEQRPDKIVCDDIEGDEMATSETMRERLRSIFEKKILNLGSFDTTYRIVGTVLHFASLLKRELDNPRKGWICKEYKAIQADGTALWPEWWSIEKLEERKQEIGTVAFEQEFQNNPLDPASQILFTSYFYENVNMENCDNFAYLDLSSGEKELNDYCAIVTLSRNRTDGKLYTVDPQRMKGKMNDIMEWFFGYYLRYKHLAIGIESNNFQRWFFQRVQEEGNKRGIYPPIMEIEQIRDKVTRAKSMSVYTENGTVLFNNSYQEFNAEVVQFPRADHDDWVDSLVEGIRLSIGGGVTSIVKTAESIKYPSNV